MKRIFISLLIFFAAYGIAYWWGVYDLKNNPPVIENDGDLATLGMMPIFLHIYGIAWGIIASSCYFISTLIKKIFRKLIKLN
jgi:hypothetical protein